MKRVNDIYDSLTSKSMDPQSALTLAEVELRDFADLAETELVANTNSEISKCKTRGRKPQIKWRSTIKEKPEADPSEVAAARWGLQAAKDFMATSSQAEASKTNALRIGVTAALRDAEGNEDLSNLIKNIDDLICNNINTRAVGSDTRAEILANACDVAVVVRAQGQGS